MGLFCFTRKKINGKYMIIDSNLYPFLYLLTVFSNNDYFKFIILNYNFMIAIKFFY